MKRFMAAAVKALKQAKNRLESSRAERRRKKQAIHELYVQALALRSIREPHERAYWATKYVLENYCGPETRQLFRQLLPISDTKNFRCHTGNCTILSSFKKQLTPAETTEESAASFSEKWRLQAGTCTL